MKTIRIVSPPAVGLYAEITMVDDLLCLKIKRDKDELTYFEEVYPGMTVYELQVLAIDMMKED